MIDFLKGLAKPKLKTINEVNVIKNNVLDNIDYMQSLRPLCEIMPVLKSNAYGHGLKEVSKIINKSSVNFICVDSVVEYQFAHKYTDKKIILMSETIHENYDFFDKKRTSFVVYNIETLRFLKSLNREIKVHFFLNTGMNREGIMKDELFNYLAVLKDSKLVLEGVCSHLSSADEIDNIDSEIQSTNFKQMYKEIEEKGFSPKLKHISASSGTLKYNDPFYTGFRPGIATYGVNPLSENDKDYVAGDPLKLSMEVNSTLMSIKTIKKGEKVSYNLTEELTKDSKLGIVPFGYYEGLSRKLSGKYHFKINGKYAKIVGKICMNITIVDLTGIDAKLGDKVEIISSNKENLNSIYNMAKITNSIPYELLVRINEKIKRNIK